MRFRSGGYFILALVLFAGISPLCFAVQPTIQSLAIYDVSNVSDPLTNTSYLVSTGLNKTYVLQTNYIYRVEFNATFSTGWSANSGDEVLHENLGTSWTINTNDIRIKNGTQEFTGGTFSSGNVNWTLTDVSVVSNQNITFLYVVNTSSAISKQVTFSINNTNNGATLASDTSIFDVRTPYLSINLTTPPLNTIVGQNLTFRINATISCFDGYCGSIDTYARYNATSSSPNTLISTSTSATPFFVMTDTNPKNCGTLSNGTNCTVSWKVNVSGNLNESYKVDVLANGTTMASNSSNNGSVQIGKVFEIQLGYTVIDFGVLAPGDTNKSANQNSIGYNVTVTQNSNPVERLWIKGTNLTVTDQAGKNCSSQTIFDPVQNTTVRSRPCEISTPNIQWSRSITGSPRSNLSENYSLVNTDLLFIYPNTNLTTYFWINIPFGIYYGGYNGTITFLANASD